MTNIALFEQLKAARREADKAKDAVIFAMASIAEMRDNETGNHIHRTQHYVRVLAEAARALFPDQLDDRTVDLIVKSAPLHDIGKVGIPDNILLKPGPLTREERASMEEHAEIGRHAIAAAQKYLDCGPFLTLAGEIAHTHHERWDGSGYPRGLAGNAIPLAGRLMAIADVYDALVSPRVYKAAMPHDDAVRLIAAERGRHFDPVLVDLFVTLAADFDLINQQFRDI